MAVIGIGVQIHARVAQRAIAAIARNVRTAHFNDFEFHES